MVRSAILQLVQDSVLRPSSILFFPVFDNFTNTESQNAEGSMSVVFSWDVILNNLIPNYINGIICVLGTNIGQRHTFRVNGENVVVLGEGDLHEAQFDHMRTSVNVSLESTDSNLGAVDNLQSVQITNAPIVCTVIVVMLFFITPAIFLLYVAAVRHKQNVIVRAAVRSTAIVDSFFLSKLMKEFTVYPKKKTDYKKDIYDTLLLLNEDGSFAQYEGLQLEKKEVTSVAGLAFLKGT